MFIIFNFDHIAILNIFSLLTLNHKHYAGNIKKNQFKYPIKWLLGS